VEIGNLVGRSLVLFNIASVGMVQLLYPIGSDPAQRREELYRLQVQVMQPYGADQIVAVSSSKALTLFKDAMKGLDGRRNPLQVADFVARYVSSEALVGSAALYTSP
jgi:hypothetical protein